MRTLIVGHGGRESALAFRMAEHSELHALMGHWLAKVVTVGVVFLSLWSAAHRLRITCYDLGVRADIAVATVVYAVALAGTAASVLYLARI